MMTLPEIGRALWCFLVGHIWVSIHEGREAHTYSHRCDRCEKMKERPRG